MKLFKRFRNKSVVLSGILFLLFSALVLLGAINKEKILYDFRLYYFSVESYKQGINYYKPLTKEHLKEIKLTGNDSIVGNKIESMGLTYVYPPVTINFFQMLTFKNYNVSAFLFTLFKLILLLVLFWLWSNIIKIDNFLIFLLFTLFAFDSTVYRDFDIGQITVIEQVFIWLGIYYFLKHKYLHFVGFIMLASTFKLTPLFFLILLLFSGDKKKYGYIFLGLACFIIYLALNYLYDPAMFREFVNTFSGHFDGNRIDGRSVYHPSLYIFIDSFYYNLSGKAFIPLYNPGIVRGTFIVVTVVIASLSCFAIKKLKTTYKNEAYENEKLVIFLLCLVYALFNPKFMCYSYILLLIPTYYLIQRISFIQPFYLLVFILIFSPRDKVFGFQHVNNLVWLYLPVVLSVGVWILYLYEIYSKPKPQSFAQGELGFNI